MRHSAWASLAALLVSAALGAGCGEEPMWGTRDAGRDGGATDGSRMCMAGEWACQGNIARQCDGRGGFTAMMVNCGTMPDRPTCSPGVGCSVCTPGASRCDAMRPQQTQRCSDDGLRWLDGEVCDEANGRTCNGGLCEDRCNPTTRTYLGCEYWPTTVVNSLLRPEFRFNVVLANPQSYPVNVRVTGGGLTNAVDRILMPGQVEPVELPWVGGLSQNTRPQCFDPINPLPPSMCIGTSALQMNGAYHVQANAPIAAYQFNPLRYRSASAFSFTNDASLLLPSTVLTRRYIVAARDNWNVRDASGATVATLGGFVAIVGVVANETGTVVNVRTTAAISGGPGVTAAPPGMQRYVLRQGDVVQLVGASPGQDLTGTVIEADNPVAVFTGHDCTNVPDARPACDHLEEQLFPLETWGQRYAVTQLRARGPDERSRVRIISQRANNTLTFDGIPAPPECNRPLGIGQSCEFETAGSFQVSGGAMLVLQYMIGQGPRMLQCGSDSMPADRPECMGDPAMVTEVPVEQFRQSYDFLVPDSYVRNFLNVVVPQGTTVALDGTMLVGSSAPVGTGYSVLFVPVMPGRHHIETMSGQGFGLKVYGVAPYTSYMYPGGLDLAQIAPPG